MTSVTGYTKTKMDDIANATIQSASISGDNLQMVRYDGSTFIAGNVRGPAGAAGAAGSLPAYSGGARPASPTRGMSILDLDTMGILVYYGATTGWRKPWSTAWGVLNQVSVGTTQGSISSTELPVTGLTFTLTLLANRLIMANAIVDIADTVANEHAACYIRDAGTVVGRGEFDTSVVATNGTIVDFKTPPYSPGGGSHQFVVGVQRLSGTGTLSVAGSVQASTLILEDLGPNGNPPAS